MHWPSFGFGVLPMFLMWLFWVVVAGLAIFLILKLSGGISGSSGSRRSEAEEILKQRYARGEITKEQYDEMLEHIRR